MASYMMYDRTLDINFNIDLIDLNIPCFLEDILDEMNCGLSSIDFILNKYSWDGKKAYEPRSHQTIIDEARQDKACLLLKIRSIKKIIKSLQ